MECRADYFAGKNVALDEGVPFHELEEQVNRAYTIVARVLPAVIVSDWPDWAVSVFVTAAAQTEATSAVVESHGKLSALETRLAMVQKDLATTKQEQKGELLDTVATPPPHASEKPLGARSKEQAQTVEGHVAKRKSLVATMLATKRAKRTHDAVPASSTEEPVGPVLTGARVSV